VKQRCELNEFIVITDKLAMTAIVFIPNELCGERARQQRDRERETEYVRDRVLLKMKDSISNKIDH
jgi:hypothetical protein